MVKKFKELLLNKFPIINIGIVILLILLYLCLFFRPKIKELLLLLPKVAQLRAEIITTEKDWANIDSFRQRLTQSNEKIDYYERKLPSEKEIPAILEYLSAAAKEMDVRIIEIKPVEQEGKIVQGSLYDKVPILLKAECGYHQLGRFLNELENADRFIKISDMKIVANPRKTNIHNVQLLLVTYVMKK